MQMAFSTLGCPKWDLAHVIEKAHELGYTGIQLRALSGSLDLLTRPEFQPDRISETRACLKAEALAVCCLDTSCTFDNPDDSVRRAQTEMALKYATLAAQLEAPLIRVFPDQIRQGSTREQTRTWIVESLGSLVAGLPSGVRIGLESHGDFAKAAESSCIIERVGDDRVVAIWDAANSFAAGDSPEEALQFLRPYLAHVHLRDARPEPGRELWQPVLAGRGQVPMRAIIEGLRSIRYQGYVCFEWEKYWHPEIEEPEVALLDFARAMERMNLFGT